jgi:hypothetical protein
MKIALHSNYTDWYDEIFDGGEGDLVFERYDDRGLTRRQMFEQFDKYMFKTPAHGLVREVAPTILETLKQEMGMQDEADTSILNPHSSSLDEMVNDAKRQMFDHFAQVVVYTDETKHHGEGKELVNAEVAMGKYPDLYCTQFYSNQPDGFGFSRKLLVVGNYLFKIEYLSVSDWRSNVGEVQTAVTHKAEIDRDVTFPYPMYSVDFVGEDFLAVDLNTAPKLEVIKKYITAETIFNAVKTFLEIKNDLPPAGIPTLTGQSDNPTIQ